MAHGEENIKIIWINLVRCNLHSPIQPQPILNAHSHSVINKKNKTLQQWNPK